jgi:hypothetical protein
MNKWIYRPTEFHYEIVEVEDTTDLTEPGYSTVDIIAGEWGIEEEKNAMLMAAAPDLMRALMLIMTETVGTWAVAAQAALRKAGVVVLETHDDYVKTYGAEPVNEYSVESAIGKSDSLFCIRADPDLSTEK